MVIPTNLELMDRGSSYLLSNKIFLVQILITLNCFDLVYFKTRVQDTSDMSEIRVRYERHECDMNATRTTGVQHERYTMTGLQHKCNTNDTSATRVKNFDSENGTSENIFSHHYISYICSKQKFTMRGTISF